MKKLAVILSIAAAVLSIALLVLVCLDVNLAGPSGSQLIVGQAKVAPGDVAGHQYEKDIQKMAEYGALRGLVASNGKFKPDSVCTQAEFVTMIDGLFPEHQLTNDSWRVKLPATQAWATEKLETIASKLGVTAKWECKTPEAKVTRGLACSMLNNMLSYENGVLAAYAGSHFSVSKALADTTDCSVADFISALWYAEGSQGDNAVSWASKKGLISHELNLVGLENATCSRAYTVWCLWKLAGSPVTSTSYCEFSDVPHGTNYEQAVAWAVQMGITQGTSDKNFSPDDHTTRGQVAVFLYRAYGRSIDLAEAWK